MLKELLYSNKLNNFEKIRILENHKKIPSTISQNLPLSQTPLKYSNLIFSINTKETHSKNQNSRKRSNDSSQEKGLTTRRGQEFYNTNFKHLPINSKLQPKSELKSSDSHSNLELKISPSSSNKKLIISQRKRSAGINQIQEQFQINRDTNINDYNSFHKRHNSMASLHNLQTKNQNNSESFKKDEGGACRLGKNQSLENLKSNYIRSSKNDRFSVSIKKNNFINISENDKEQSLQRKKGFSNEMDLDANPTKGNETPQKKNVELKLKDSQHNPHSFGVYQLKSNLSKIFPAQKSNIKQNEEENKNYIIKYLVHNNPGFGFKKVSKKNTSSTSNTNINTNETTYPTIQGKKNVR